MKNKTIALVAHDNRKKDLVEWVEWNYKTLLEFNLVCTGTTGRLVEETLLKQIDIKQKRMDMPTITKLMSGPLGGDQQLGAMITEGKINIFIFLWDPMEPQPHDVDVKALLRISALYNIPTAPNRSTADFIISSPLLMEHYTPMLKDYKSYITRNI